MAYLNLLTVCRAGTRALGPGLRYALWVQGCPFACPGCATPEGREIEARLMTDTERVADDILSRPGITGITVSGGEPMLQAASLADLIARVHKRRPEIDVIVFTGYLVEQLTWPDAKALLGHIDVLIDGQYRQDLNDGTGLRGSTNQRIIHLTDRLAEYKQEMLSGKRISEIDIHEKETLIIGIPPQANDHPASPATKTDTSTEN